MTGPDLLGTGMLSASDPFLQPDAHTGRFTDWVSGSSPRTIPILQHRKCCSDASDQALLPSEPADCRCIISKSWDRFSGTASFKA